jgi:hypothetical protein
VEDDREELAAIEDRVERQLLLLDWWFRRFRDHLPEENVIHFESLVSSGKVLSVITRSARALDEALRSKNCSSVQGREETVAVGERLLESDGAHWSFYFRPEVEDLLERVKTPPYE